MWILFSVRNSCLMENEITDVVEEKEEDVEEIVIHWFACEGTQLMEKEFFDAVLNNEKYFEDTDNWVMELLLFEIFKMN